MPPLAPGLRGPRTGRPGLECRRELDGVGQATAQRAGREVPFVDGDRGVRIVAGAELGTAVAQWAIGLDESTGLLAAVR